METVDAILADKGYEVYSIPPHATVHQAVELMCARRVGALLVANEDATVGIITERDVLTRVILEQREPAHTRVDQVMTRALACIHEHAEAREAMAVMTERRCRHLPVVADGGVIGVVSMGDLVRWASREQEFEIRMLTDYVRGEYR